VADDIGDVYVDVGVDTSTAEAKLKAKLEALSKKLTAKINAVVETKAAEASLAGLRAAANKAVSMPVEISKSSFDGVAAFGFAAKKELNAAIGTIKILTSVDGIAFVKAQIRAIPGVAKDLVSSVRTSVSTALATGELGVWVREQSLKTVHIGVDISKAALGKAQAQLSSFTGLNAVRGEFEKFSQGLAGFFDNLPGVAQSILKMSSMVSLLGTALGSALVTINLLGSAVPGLGAAALALPGILAAGAAEAAVLVVAIKDAPPAVKAAISAYKSLGKEIANNFWSGASAQVITFFKTVKSAAQLGLDNVATTMGTLTGMLASSLQNSLGGGVLDKIFSNIDAGLSALAPAVAPFANILATLGVYGTSLLPGISGWLDKIAVTFNAWLSNAVATGALTQDLTVLGGVLKIIWNAGAAIIGIFSGLGTAASNAGIGNLLTPLQMIANIVNSPTFQTALTTLFTGMSVGASALLSALVPIGNLIATLAPTIANFLGGAGAAIGGLFTSLANALNSPVFQQGLSSFFSGILDFVKPLIPIMPIFAEKLSLIGTFAGNLLTVLGPVFATLISTLVPIFGQVLGAVSPLVDALGPVLSGVFTALGPLISSVVTLAKPFLNLIVMLLPPILSLVQAVVSGLAPVFTALAPVFQQLVTAVMSFITPILQILMPLIAPLIQLLIPLITVALQPLTVAFQILGAIIGALAPVLTLIAQIIGAVIQTIVDLFTGNFSDIGKVWSGVWQGIIDFYNTTVKPLWLGLFNFFAGIWKSITALFTGFWTDVISGIKLFGAIIAAVWNKQWSDIGSVFQNVWNGIAGFAKGVFNSIMSGIQGFVNGAIDVINGLIGGLGSITAVVGIKLGKIPHVSLPKLAMGATVLPRPGGTAAILGEGGRAESVVDTGMMNKLLATILETFPAAVSALRASAVAPAVAAATGSSTVHNWDVDLEMPDNPDQKAAAQEVVNRLAEKVAS
jgi:phage-related protein